LTDDRVSVPDDVVVRAALERVDDFALLYERHAMSVYRYCFNQTRDEDVANDLTAQVFIRAIDRLHQYRPKPGATFRSWIFAIARNIVVDHWRRELRSQPLDRVMDGLATREPGPEEIAIHRTQMDDLTDALACLPGRYRDIVHLRLAGLTTNEIADSLGMTVSATKSAQTRAYRQLRDILEPPEVRRS